MIYSLRFPVNLLPLFKLLHRRFTTFSNLDIQEFRFLMKMIIMLLVLF